MYMHRVPIRLYTSLSDVIFIMMRRLQMGWEMLVAAHLTKDAWWIENVRVLLLCACLWRCSVRWTFEIDAQIVHWIRVSRAHVS